jgi:hypothetical protein
VPTPDAAAPPSPTVEPPALASYAELIGGLRQVTAVEVGAASVAFSQHAAAAGRLRWTLDLSFYVLGQKRAGKRSPAKVRKPLHLAASRRAITKAGTVRGRLKLGSSARALLERHPAARLVLRTTMTLDGQRVIRATKTLSR